MKTQEPSAISFQPSAKAGVVLLVILGLLAVLALLGIMFTSLSGSEEDAARRFFNAFANERPELPPDAVFTPVLGQIVADTTNPLSVFLGHSLLRDMYGDDCDLFDFLGNPAPNGRIDSSERYRRAFNGPGDRGADDVIASVDDADPNFIFNGRRPERPLLPTGLGGGFDEDYDAPDHQNMFMGLIGWTQSGGTWVPLVLAPSYHRPGLINPTDRWIYTPPSGTPVLWQMVDDWGDNCLVNGVFTPFPKSVQDTTSSPLTYPAARGRRLILRPRPIDHLSVEDRMRIRNKQIALAFGLDKAPGRVGVDDDGDGIIDRDSNTGHWDLGELGYPGSDDLGLRRPAVFSYDVDNDADGVLDSVWLDPGLPVQRTLDGRRFKAMVAVLCVDQDGKLNLNVHGSLGHDKINAAGQWVFPGSTGEGTPNSHPDLANTVHTGIAGLVVSLGSGASPTEFNLQNIFSPSFFPTVYAPGSPYSVREFQWLLEGRLCGRTPVAGRFGEESLLFTAAVRPRPGLTESDNDWPRLPYRSYSYFGDRNEAAPYGSLGPDDKPGVANFDDDGNGTVDDPSERGWPGSDDGQYRQPIDSNGNGATWLDPFGRHRFGPWTVPFLGSGGNATGWPTQWGQFVGVGIDGQPGVANADDDGNGKVDDIWELGWPGSDDVGRPQEWNESDELNLFSPVATDKLFTVRDLEALLRFHDLNGHLLANGLVGPDGKPGKAGVDDNSNGTVDESNELGWPGSDDIILQGSDGRPGFAGTDDDQDGFTDNFTELGWRGSDDVVNTRLGALAPSLFDKLLDANVAARRRSMLTTESWDVTGYGLFPLFNPASPQTSPLTNETRGVAWGLSNVKGNGGFNYIGLTAKSPGGVGIPVKQSPSEPAGRPAPLAPGLVWLAGADGAPGTASGNPPGNLPWLGNDDQDGGSSPGTQNEADELGWDLSDDYWLPSFLAAGRRLDLNRPFLNFPTTSASSPSYYAAAPVLEANDPRALARDIYLLLRQLRPGLNPSVLENREAIERMAQFAVNVIDFRDADDVMTGFEFDYNLGNGWNVDGDISTTNETPGMPATDRGVVWGVEAPRLVINETFAYETTSDGVQLWFELYNPGLPSLDDPNSDVDLATKDVAGTRQPTYQMILANRNPDPKTGEPSDLSRKFIFEPAPGGAASSTTKLSGGGYLFVGPDSPKASPGAPSVDFDTLTDPFGVIAQDPLTNKDWRLYLRRLADPNRAPDPGPDAMMDTPDDLNPYITIDALDVEVFSQADATPDPMTGTYKYGSFERKEAYSVGSDFNDSGAGAPPSVDAHSLKVENKKATKPFAPLTFNDRPFTSPMELLLVPGVRPQWLTTAFIRPSGDINPFDPKTGIGEEGMSNFKTGNPRNASMPFVKLSDPGADLKPGVVFVDDDGNGTVDDAAELGWQGSDDTPPDYYFGHVLNFFREDVNANVPRSYYRLLEFVEVPSRMNGSRNAFLNPNSSDDRLDRVPGKMNLNTITSPEVLLAVFNNHPAALVKTDGTAISTAGESAIWQWLKTSRDGLDGFIGSVDDRPFRSFGVGATSDIPDTTSSASGFWKPSIHSTTLRGTVIPKHVDPFVGPDGQPGKAGVDDDGNSIVDDSTELNWPGSDDLAVFQPTPKSPDRPIGQDDRPASPPGIVGPSSLRGFNYFQNQPLSKIGNLVTTRSNVYAVWITVGFFEVVAEPTANEVDDDGDGFIDEPDELMPRLGQEVGILTNKTVRHRGFYIIDRSRAKGYAGPPRTPSELKDVLNEVVIYSRTIE